MTILTQEQRNEIEKSNGTPARFVDPETSVEYVVLRADLYDRVKPLFEGDELSRQEELALLRIAGEAAGWDDPVMDVYDKLDPRRKP